MGLINKAGKEIIPIRYNRITKYTDSYYMVSMEGNSWGYVDLKGNEYFKDTK